MRASVAPGSSRATRVGQGPGDLAHERVVQKEKGLRGHDRLAAHRDDRAGIGAVEQPAEVGRARSGAHRLKVQRPARYGQVRERRSRPRLASSRPATASRLSRIASASRRRRFIRPKRRLSGSLANASAPARLLC